MFKKYGLILITLIIIASLFTGCTTLYAEDQAISTKAPYGQMAFIDIVDAISIKIIDVVDNRYDDTLDITLTQDEFQKIKEAFYEGVEVKNAQFDSMPLYSLQFLDKDGKETGCLIVDKQNTLQMRDGTSFYRRGEIDKVLSSIEEKYEIKKDKCLRKPGENYFSLLSYAYKGAFYEVMESDFIEGLYTELDTDQIHKLEIAAKDFQVKDQRENVSTNLKYVVQIYSIGGGLICELRMFKDGTVCTMEGYEIESSQIKNWIENVIEENTKI